jgi:hypothetical protein
MKKSKTLINKVANIRRDMDLLYKNLFFQALPEENKRDFYRACDEMKTFADNLYYERN